MLSRYRVQFVYEDYWIGRLASHYIGKKWDNQQPQETDENFFAFLTAVTSGLRAIGTEVELLARRRLLKLAANVRKNGWPGDWRRA
jgi:hypothetical protein